MFRLPHIFKRSIKPAQVLVLALVFTLLISVGVAAAGALNFRAHLSGNYAIPALVDTRAQGQAIFMFNDDETISYKLNVANIKNIRMAHIHLMPASGTGNGPILVWLYPAQPPFATIPGRFDGTLAQGTITQDDLQFSSVPALTMDQLKAYIVSGETYVNVHTDQFPAGEIHGPVH